MKPKTDTEPTTHFDPHLIDELLAGQSTPQAIQGLIDQFTKTVLERALNGELTYHLGYAKHAKEKTGNTRGWHFAQNLEDQTRGIGVVYSPRPQRYFRAATRRQTSDPMGRL